MRSKYDWHSQALRNANFCGVASPRDSSSGIVRYRSGRRQSLRTEIKDLTQNSMTTTRLQRAAIRLHRFLHDNLGPTDDWTLRFTGTEAALPKLCELLNNLQDEIERAGHQPARWNFKAR